MARRITIGACAALFVFAFIAAPRSCEWGLSAYVWSGIAALAGLLALPAAIERGRPMERRIAAGLGHAAFALATWLAGLLAADFQLLCRLF